MITNRASLSTTKSDIQVKQYRLEHQLSIQKTALEFMEGLLHIEIPSENPHAVLKDGVLLCQLLNRIQPGTVPQISNSMTPFSQMSNIYNFINGATKLGLENSDLFETVDLYEGKDMTRVYMALLAVSRKICKMNVPKRNTSDRDKEKLKGSPITDTTIFNQNENKKVASPESIQPSIAKKSTTIAVTPANTPTNTNNLGHARIVGYKPMLPMAPKREKSYVNDKPSHKDTPNSNQNRNSMFQFPPKEKQPSKENRSSMFQFPPRNAPTSKSTADSPLFAKPEARTSSLPQFQKVENKVKDSIQKFDIKKRIPPPINLDKSCSDSDSEILSPKSKDVSDKIRNLKLFFDAGLTSSPTMKKSPDLMQIPRPNTPKITVENNEPERHTSTPNLLASTPLQTSQSEPSRLKGASTESEYFSELDIVSQSMALDTSVTLHDINTSMLTESTETNEDRSQNEIRLQDSNLDEIVPTVEDRVIKPANYRVGKGGIIEDLDLSIKRPNESSRKDILRLDQFDWSLEDDDNESMFSSVSSAFSTKYKENDKNDPTPLQNSRINGTLQRNYSLAETVRSNFMKENNTLRKTHSRNYSEKPTISSQRPSPPQPRPRSGSAGPNDYKMGRISLYFEDARVQTELQFGDSIGKGQFGVVYKALNLQTGQIVAVKRIDLEDRSEVEVEALMSEVDLLKSLRHLRVVNYEGYVKTETHLNIILEFVENGSLLSLLRSYGTFSETLVASYTAQILEGLMYLHGKQVVHCDLKAANILTTKNGKVKLTDFGVSLNLGVKDSDLGEIVAGTPNWMAPEVIQLQGASTASDIWSLGCTIVELLTGKPPYADMNSMAALFHIVEDECPPLPANISKPLQNFLELCFQKSPTLRPTAELLSYHHWILDSQLTREVNSKLNLQELEQEQLIEEKRRDLQITDQLWETFNTLSDPTTLLTPPPLTTTMRLPDHDHDVEAAMEHHFVKSTVEQAITCKVCNLPIKRQAMICEDCTLICHFKCSSSPNLICHHRSEPILFNRSQFSTQPPGTKPHQHNRTTSTPRYVQSQPTQGTDYLRPTSEHNAVATVTNSLVKHHKNPSSSSSKIKRKADECRMS